MRRTTSEDVGLLLDAARIGLHVQTLCDLRGLEEEEVSGLLDECAEHEANGTLVPMYPPFLRKMVTLLKDAGLVRKQDE